MQHTTEANLRISQLASEFGLNPKTIRYYEEIGLLSAPKRSEAGYRLYGSPDRERLAFIQKAKAIGLSLTEIRELLTLRSKGKQPCEHVVELLAQKLMAVDSQLRALEAFRAELLSLQDEAAETRDAEGCVCGIIEQHDPACFLPSLPSFPG
jgi:DNA-binding transcriptional MerR regulator